MSTPRNVLLVANYRPDVGYAWWLMENFWIQLSELCRRSGGRCVLIYPAEGRIPDAIGEASIEVRFHDFDDRSPPGLRRLVGLIRRYRIDAVYLTDKRYLDPLYGLLRLAGVSDVIVHDHIPGERPRPPYWKWVAKRVLHELRVVSASKYIGVSRFVADRAVNVGGVPPSRVTFVHNGIPLDGGFSGPGASPRESLGISDGEMMIVSVGRAHTYKGVDFMVEVASHLRERTEVPVKFVHVGDGPHLDRFREQASESDLAEHFIFPGHRDDVPAILRTADVAIHASKGEAFSLAILEYMAAGLPVLAPDHCGNSEAVVDGQTGFLYTPEDLPEAVGHLSRLVRDADLRERMGRAGRRRVEEKFTLEKCNADFRRVVGSQLELR